ncbi:MAG: YlbF family regulator [Erysipelotrichaceae bacterium]|jgi:hypothetical protein|nr:YlbF family regulator [Erysipelotrichaceae bacterium]
MQPKIKALIDKFSLSLLEEPVFKEYFALQKQIERSKELKEMNAQLNDLKQRITKNLLNETEHQIAKDAYELGLKDYLSHPLVHNFMIVEQEVEEILYYLKKGIES